MNFDPAVREILAKSLKIAFADERGRLASGPGPGVVRYAVLGPVPLPVTLHGRTYRFQWFTYARYPQGDGPENLSPEVVLQRLSSADDLPNSVLVMGDLNRTDAPLTQSLTTGLAQGSYCDVFSGNFAAGACSGKAVTVDATGSAAFDVPPMSAVALHVGAKL